MTFISPNIQVCCILSIVKIIKAAVSDEQPHVPQLTFITTHLWWNSGNKTSVTKTQNMWLTCKNESKHRHGFCLHCVCVRPSSHPTPPTRPGIRTCVGLCAPPSTQFCKLNKASQNWRDLSWAQSSFPSKTVCHITSTVRGFRGSLSLSVWQLYVAYGKQHHIISTRLKRLPEEDCEIRLELYVIFIKRLNACFVNTGG